MTTYERYTGIQSIMESCGRYGCNFLCLLSIAEETIGKPIDFITAWNSCRKYLKDDFYVWDNNKVLKVLTGKNWLRREMSNIEGQLSSNEYSIAVYYNPRTGRHHYRRRSFDTLLDSVTVKEGYIEKYYVYAHD